MWAETLKVWCIRNFSNNPRSYYDIANQVVWLNSNIRIGRKPVFIKSWYNRGVTYIRDLLDNDKRHFLTLEGFKNKYNVECTFLAYYSLLHSIIIYNIIYNIYIAPESNKDYCSKALYIKIELT